MTINHSYVSVSEDDNSTHILNGQTAPPSQFAVKPYRFSFCQFCEKLKPFFFCEKYATFPPHVFDNPP